MTTIRLAVDFDDVTGDFNTPFAAWHNERFGTTIQYKDITTFNLLQVYEISRQEFNERAQEFLHQHHDTIALIPGAADGMRRLHDRGIELHIVTSRWDSLAKITADYLDQRLPSLIADIHFANGHHEHHGSKVEICQDLGVVALKDDALHHAELVAAAGIPTLLHDRPWNQCAAVAENIIRCGSWKQSTSGWEKSVRWVEENLL